MIKKYISILILVLSINATYAQIGNWGIPFIRNYSNKEYKSANQNFSIVQDNRGVMYFANSTSILEFDGVNWRKIQIPKNPYIYSLAKDSKGRIYVGAAGDFGYLSPVESGNLTYVSLLDKLPDSLQTKVATVKKIAITKDDDVVFISTSVVYVFKDDKISMFFLHSKKPSSAFSFFYFVNDDLYIQEKEYGIVKYSEGKLKLLPGTEKFARKWTTGMFDAGNGKIIIVDFKRNNKNVSLYNKGQITDIEKSYFLTNLYTSTHYRKEGYALGLWSSGLLLTDKNLDIQKHIYTKNGLQNDRVVSVYADSSNNIWLGLDNGISIVYQNSPFTRFADNFGLTATTYTSATHNGNLYVGNGTGVYFMNRERKPGKEDVSFTKVENPKGATQVWKIDTVNNVLLCAATNGFMYVENNVAKYIKNDESTRTFIRIDENKNQILAGGKNLILYEFDGKKWGYKHTVKGFNMQCRHIEQDKDGTFWVSDRVKGIYHIKLTPKLDSVIYDKHYTKSGLPSVLNNYVYKINNKIVFTTEKGVYKFDEKTKTFVKDNFFQNIFKKDLKITNLYQAKNGSIWFKEEKSRIVNKSNEAYWELGEIKQVKDSFITYRTPFNKLKSNIYSINSISDSELIIGSEKGFILYNSQYKKDYNKPYQTLVRGVDILRNDSLLFGGAFADSTGIQSITQSEETVPSLDYKFNGLRFIFSATFYDEPEKTKYSWILVGNDVSWSDWKSETAKEYSNLSPGLYTFKVKAKNLYNVESEVAEFKFEILPPWYRSIWAYIFYLIAISFIIWGIVQLSIRRIKQQKIKLEKIVKERTYEIRIKNEALEQSKEEIEAQRDEIELKNVKLSEINEEIVSKSKEIAAKNKDITASINYAKRIQEAMLPLKEQIKNALPEHFILFKPRDIVSGDFYWFGEVEDKIIITAVDCTGHGVPGAFMSMIGSEILTTIANKKITDSGVILDKMNEYVIKALKQDENDNQDGMDMALLVIDKKTKTVQYSGAKNPLVYIQNNELIQIKADRKAIGGQQLRKTPFEKHVIKYSEENPIVFYLFSDGYQDQFGGSKKRKFMIKKMKDLFFDIHHKPMQEQHDILNTTIDDWMGAMHQTDDIIVIGLKLQ